MTTAYFKEKIKSSLNKIPEEYLNNVDEYIQFIIYKNKGQNKKIEKMKGIWENIGFEKLSNLEDEIKNIRKLSQNNLLNRIDCR